MNVDAAKDSFYDASHNQECMIAQEMCRCRVCVSPSSVGVEPVCVSANVSTNKHEEDDFSDDVTESFRNGSNRSSPAATVSVATITQDQRDNYHRNAGNRILEVSPAIFKTPQKMLPSGLRHELMDRKEELTQTRVVKSIAMQCHERVVQNSPSSTSSSVNSESAAMRGIKKDEGTYIHICGTKKQENNNGHEGTGTDSNQITENHHLFKAGQHVFVIIGKTEHPAVIVSLEHQMVWVRWSTMGTPEKVEVGQVRPMFEEKNDDLCSSSFSVRSRQPTNRYAPMLQEMPRKQIKREENETLKSKSMLGEQLKAQSGSKKARTKDILYSVVPDLSALSPRKRIKTDRYLPPVWLSMTNTTAHQSSKANTLNTISAPNNIDARKQSKLDSDYIIENLDTLPRVPPGVAPGHGWKAIYDERYGQRKAHWISPTGIKFRRPRCAFEFERIKRKLDGDEVQAYALYKSQRAATKKEASAETAIPISKSLSTRARTKTNRYSPPDWSSKEAGSNHMAEQDVFHKRNTNMGGKEKPATLITRPAKRTRLPTDRYTPPTNNCRVQKGSDSSGQLEPSKGAKGHASVVVPDSRLKAKSLTQAGWRTSIQWISPSGKRFCRLKSAYKFEQMKKQLNDDETEAWALYKRRHKAGKHAPKTATPEDKSPTRKTHKCSQNEHEESGSNSDARSKQQRRHRAKKGPSSTEVPASTEVHSQPRKLSELEESEYKSLWICYMDPVVRMNEEISSGMVIRKKRALCSLLRSKGSTFRQSLHRRILDLAKKGEKVEILQILRDMKQFDMSMQSDDGPPHLVANILGPQEDDNEIEVLDSIAISEMQSRNKTIECNDALVDLSSSCDGLDTVDVSGNSKCGVSKATAVLTDPEQSVQLENNSFLVAPTNLGHNRSGIFRSVAQGSAASNEVIDLSQDDDVSSRKKAPIQSAEIIDLLEDDDADEVILIE